MRKKATFQVEKQLANEQLEKIIGGASSSKISVTISMAQSSVLSESSSGKDKDSDADESIKTTDN